MTNLQIALESTSHLDSRELPYSSGQHDFDFFFGDWNIHNRRLKERLAGCTEWIEFEATSVVRPIWGGLAHMDEYDAKETPLGHLQGMTVRLFDPKSQQWTIYWAYAGNGKFDTPMIGSFTNGVGEFYDQEMFEGRAIYVRFLWSNISQASARWEQAFSEDGGRTWETNWVMEFRRPT
jgi:hypothetical protein